MRNSGWRFSSSARALVLGAALLVAYPPRLPAQGQRSAYEELQTFSGVLNHIRLNYPDSVSYSELVAAAIRGVLRALDPHSTYQSRVEWEKRSALERGELFSVGIALEEVDGVATVLAVARRGPAAKGGVLPGDRVLALNDTSVAGLDMPTLELRLAGEKGSKVRLRLERGPRLEPDTFSVALKRNSFEVRSVSTVRMVDSTTGFLRLEDFLGKASDEVHDGLKRLRAMRAQRVILDLRANPGGNVVYAVEIASEFFPRNTVIFRTKGRKRDVDTTYVTKRDGEFRDLPLIVLIDERSASAAEALAGSLQDHDRALLVGRRSFGKALMQTIFLLPTGDNVWLTVGRVLTPNGRFIQRRYRGIGYEQYISFAGKTGAGEDTSTIFKTDAGREVRGGGGIAPDVVVPIVAPLPVWWSAAADSGFDDAVSDSVAHTLAATAAAQKAWLHADAEWRVKLVPPFLTRVRSRLGLAAQADSLLERRLARILAARVAEVRWGPDAREEFQVANDPTIRAAVDRFPRLRELLAVAPK
ncbi:MAG TPA: S41 family peptidase [Gemmatimonadales bacterium]|jgi:carboxyl-terminal processing protease|nr:S41 family peptidase [Gemmatimonadales bacterium]